MNRKISTLFTAGLLVAGSLCGSAFAQESIQSILGWSSPLSAVSALEDGKYYVMTNSSNEAYGFELEDGVLDEVIRGISDNVTPGLEDVADVQKYVWKVSVSQNLGTVSYKFTNVSTGKSLRINTTTNGFVTPPVVPVVEFDYSSTDAAVRDVFVFGASSNTTNPYSSRNKTLFLYDATNTYQMTWSASASSVETTATTGDISFYKVESISFDDAAELNSLYNGSGFTFTSKRLTDQTAEPIGNLFNEKRVVARYVAAGSEVKVDETDPSYATVAADMKIPAGMYFFTENAPKLKYDRDGDGVLDAVSDDYKDWMNATVLVVSSTQTVEATNAERVKGDGFALTEMKISDLNLYTGTKSQWKTQGDQVSIKNAAFTVKKSYTSAYPYELSLNDFRFKKQASKADHADASVKLEVLQHNDEFYLTTTHATADQYIFTLAAAGMKKGIELLNEEAKVSVYNIRVVDGKKNDVKSVYGKFLTNAVNARGNFEYVAKAKVLSQPETPAYQWAITSIDGDYNVTFTNRETDESFTASLFPKADLGENVYELATDQKTVTPIYVDENTYRETTKDAIKDDLQQLNVELIKVDDVNPLAGFLDVADKTMVTMAFARDNNETSNKWYAAVDGEGTIANPYKLNEDDKFVNELSGAAQWQLIKGKKQTIIERSFVYNKDGRVTVQAKGDKAYAYEYQLQYINDGKETEMCFPNEGTNSASAYAVAAEDELVDLEDINNTLGAKFIIKLAADGSVYLIETGKTNSSTPSIFDNNTHSDVKVILDNTNDEYIYETEKNSVYAMPLSTDQDLTLKTYLIEEAPEVSYPAKEGHISLVSELGNYISVNEKREGIVVNQEQYTFYLQVTDEEAVVPSFYISKKGAVENGNRLFLFNPKDSVDYYVATGTYDRDYQWAENVNKAIFKVATLEANKDTLSTVVKGNEVKVANKADDEGVLGGLDNFKVQIILAEDTEDTYLIRSVSGNKSTYLYSLNDKLAWGDKSNAMRFTITAGDPTSNESVADAAEGIKVIAGNGMIEIQGAAGKMVSVTNVLGKSIANTVLTSDNATITVPAGIVVVSVEGEEAVKAIVK